MTRDQSHLPEVLHVEATGLRGRDLGFPEKWDISLRSDSRDSMCMVLFCRVVQESSGLPIKLSLVSDTLSWSNPLRRGGDMGDMSPPKPRCKEVSYLSSRMFLKVLCMLLVILGNWLNGCKPTSRLVMSRPITWPCSTIRTTWCKNLGSAHVSTIQTTGHLSQCYFLCRHNCLYGGGCTNQN